MFIRRPVDMRTAGQAASQCQASQTAGERVTSAHRHLSAVSDSGCEDSDGRHSGTGSPRIDLDCMIHQSPGCTAGSPSPKRTKTVSGDGAHYARTKIGPDERRQRKKELNKNAATRYRQKKQAEFEGILYMEKGLRSKNEELKLKLTDMQKEIKYLKSLMKDVFKAKGLIK
ncbi:hypothetical protein AAG570_013729 [Ranatra chinensis]|uniref:BZIP domain-containing protein n=1 Tax=Ranatra chinensis TaxID=642074 RepID=A0ABD0YEX6_9HEMI